MVLLEEVDAWEEVVVLHVAVLDVAAAACAFEVVLVGRLVGADHLVEIVGIVGVAHLEARLESVETVVEDDRQIVEVGLAQVLVLVLVPVLVLEAGPSVVGPFEVAPSGVDPFEVDPFEADPSEAAPSEADPFGVAPA